jgi:hypothetical protein
MAIINNLGNIIARCPGCNGALASFEWQQTGSQSALGVITTTLKKPPNQEMDRAAAGMFRSVLDKTLRANGYKGKEGTTLKQQIDTAAADGVITEARKKRAHDEIRVLGNDVLHDEWHEIKEVDVELARHYSQRILEDLYDDRESVLALLRVAQRTPDEDKKPTIEPTGIKPV